MEEKPIFFFNHKNAITQDRYNSDKNLSSNYEVVALSKLQGSGTPIVAFVKHKEMPFYGVQFHPEKNEFEAKSNVDHEQRSVAIMKRLADFFIDQVGYMAKEKEAFFRGFLSDYVLMDMDDF